METKTAQELLLRMLQLGVASFDHATGELRFNGLRYSAADGDWNGLLNVIGWNKARAAIAKAEGRQA